MELNHLKYFYEVAKEGSFTKASKKLRVSQPSISKMVKQIEYLQDVKLFDREKRAVRLTEMGKIFFRSCQNIFDEIGNLKREIERSKSECAGDLSIGASDNLCNYVLPKLLPSFCQTYPKVKVKLFSGTSSAIRADIQEGKSELGLFYTPVQEKDFETEKIGFVEFAIVASIKGELDSSKNFKPDLLENLGYIGSRIDDYAKPYPACQMMIETLGIKPNLIFETNNQETQKRMTIEGHGYTVVPLFMVIEEIKKGRLIRVTTPRPIGSHLYFVKKKNRSLSKRALLFFQYLKKKLQVALDHQDVAAEELTTTEAQ